MHNIFILKQERVTVLYVGTTDGTFDNYFKTLEIEKKRYKTSRHCSSPYFNFKYTNKRKGYTHVYSFLKGCKPATKAVIKFWQIHFWGVEHLVQLLCDIVYNISYNKNNIK